MSTLSPLALAEMLVSVADDKKAWDPVIVDLRGKTTIADYFVICDGETDRQIRSIADAMMERARREGIRPLSVDGYDEAAWILLDFDSVLAHVFLPGERSYYDLEALWAASEKRRVSKSSSSAR
ncbi:MAG TPA: ribosome silencing factor [Candidatus Dormibacteraeota bacterium]|nr:ribosome silencing factor [Candidatus Dormibacteraeota bacterium]